MILDKEILLTEEEFEKMNFDEEEAEAGTWEETQVDCPHCTHKNEISVDYEQCDGVQSVTKCAVCGNEFKVGYKVLIQIYTSK